MNAIDRNKFMDIVWNHILGLRPSGDPPPRSDTEYEDLHDLWLKTSRLFSRYDLVYWASSGTLLGAVRDEDIIRHDDDIDVAMPAHSYERLISIPESEFPEGIRIRHVRAGHVLSQKLASAYCPLTAHTCEAILLRMPYVRDFTFTQIQSIATGLWVDVYDMTRDGEWWKPNEGIAWRYPDERFHESDVFPLKTLRLGNHTISAPSNPIPYLTANYGSEWHVPRVTHSHAGVSIDQVMNKIDDVSIYFQAPVAALAAMFSMDVIRGMNPFKLEL